jgi:hypothetical protein
MRSAGFSDEDLHLFQDAWKSMIAEDLEYMPLIRVWYLTFTVFTSGSHQYHLEASAIGTTRFSVLQNNGRSTLLA